MATIFRSEEDAYLTWVSLLKWTAGACAIGVLSGAAMILGSADSLLLAMFSTFALFWFYLFLVATSFCVLRRIRVIGLCKVILIPPAIFGLTLVAVYTIPPKVIRSHFDNNIGTYERAVRYAEVHRDEMGSQVILPSDIAVVCGPVAYPGDGFVRFGAEPVPLPFFTVYQFTKVTGKPPQHLRSAEKVGPGWYLSSWED
ncbi:MAG TPA: hypothetical protein PKA27_09375 [Fimbriimonadaceae bacterium]|nr:hypothetical protein [Fimbriimonadaceae bacterium]